MAGRLKKIKPEELENSVFAAFLEFLRVGESDIDGMLFTDAPPEGADFSGVSFTRCYFRGCRFTGAVMEQCSFVDAVFEACDFSGTALHESFWQRCTLSGCRMTGARLDGARFRQAVLKDCTARYAGIDLAVLDRVTLTACDFQEASLRGCTLKEVKAAGCDFLLVNFYQTTLAGMDFTGSEIGGWTLSASAEELRGAVVTPLQAVELAERLGLVVRDAPVQ